MIPSILNNHCGNIPDIAGKSAQAIIERMRMFADMPTYLPNWVCFADWSLEASTFIFAVKGIGTQDHGMGGGRRLWCRRDHRSMAVSRHSTNSYRRLTLLEERLPGPELDEIPALLSLVNEQNWAQYNSVRVGDLLHNMVSLQKNLRSQLDEAERCLAIEKSDHDKTWKSMVAAEEDLKHRNGQLDRTWSDLDAAREQIHKFHRQLDDAHRYIDYLKRTHRESRSAPTLYVPTAGAENHSAQDDEGMQSPEYFLNMEVTRSGHTRHETAPAREPIATKGTSSSSGRISAPTENIESAANIPKVKRGYLIHKMPRKKNQRSAQTTEADSMSKENSADIDKQAAIEAENKTPSPVVHK